MLTTNSRAAFTSSCEYRDGRIATLSIGGEEQAVPAQASVMMLGVSASPVTLRSTTGVGSSAADGLRAIFMRPPRGPGSIVPYGRNRTPLATGARHS